MTKRTKAAPPPIPTVVDMTYEQRDSMYYLADKIGCEKSRDAANFLDMRLKNWAETWPNDAAYRPYTPAQAAGR